jgi:hypothetical protein
MIRKSVVRFSDKIMRQTGASYVQIIGRRGHIAFAFDRRGTSAESIT